MDEHDLTTGGKLVFCNAIVGGVIDNKFLPSILKGIMEKMERGPSPAHRHATSGSRCTTARCTRWTATM